VTTELYTCDELPDNILHDSYDGSNHTIYPG